MSKKPIKPKQHQDIRHLVSRAEVALDTLYDLVQKFPDSTHRNGQLRYLDDCYRSMRRMRSIIGGVSRLKP